MKYSYRGWRLEVAASAYKKDCLRLKKFRRELALGRAPNPPSRDFHASRVAGEPHDFFFCFDCAGLRRLIRGQLLRDPTTITWFNR